MPTIGGNVNNILVTKVILALLIATVFIGCQNEGAQLTGPGTDPSTNVPQFVLLPQAEGAAKLITATANVTVAQGGDLHLINVVGGKQAYSVDLHVKWAAGSVSNDFAANMMMDSYYLMSSVDMQFGPHGTEFLQPALLTIKASGLDLSAFAGRKTLSIYFDNNGVWEKMVGTVTIDPSKGTLTCTDGQLPHFSRYAFGI